MSLFIKPWQTTPKHWLILLEATGWEDRNKSNRNIMWGAVVCFHNRRPNPSVDTATAMLLKSDWARIAFFPRLKNLPWILDSGDPHDIGIEPSSMLSSEQNYKMPRRHNIPQASYHCASTINVWLVTQQLLKNASLVQYSQQYITHCYTKLSFQ